MHRMIRDSTLLRLRRKSKLPLGLKLIILVDMGSKMPNPSCAPYISSHCGIARLFYKSKCRKPRFHKVTIIANKKGTERVSEEYRYALAVSVLVLMAHSAVRLRKH